MVLNKKSKGVDKVNKFKNRLFVIISLLIIFILAGCEFSKQTPIEPASPVPLIGAVETVAPTEISLSDNSTFTTEQNANIQTNETQTEIAEEMYIGNKNSKKFHRPSCNTLPAEKNSIYFSSRNEAIDSGFSSCGNCRP